MVDVTPREVSGGPATAGESMLLFVSDTMKSDASMVSENKSMVLEGCEGGVNGTKGACDVEGVFV